MCLESPRGHQLEALALPPMPKADAGVFVERVREILYFQELTGQKPPKKKDLTFNRESQQEVGSFKNFPYPSPNPGIGMRLQGGIPALSFMC
jgi:hypothetical protein